MYFLWQIYSGPHSTTHGLPQVDSGTPISASNFQVHCRLERTSGQSCMLNLRVTLRCWPVWDTTSSVPALDPFMHCISCSIFPVHLTVTTCLSLFKKKKNKSVLVARQRILSYIEVALSNLGPNNA